MRCLVTGGAGFIGSSVVRALLAQGHSVRVVDNFSTGKRENLAGVGGIEVIAADLRDSAALAEALGGVECAFHLAALVSVPRSVAEPQADQEVNCGLTVQLLRQALKAGVRRVVYSSSAAVYGDGNALPLREDSCCLPLSPYGVSKYAGELYTRMYARCYGVETVALRYFNVYGPRQDPGSGYSGVLSRFLAAAAGDTAPTVCGDGAQTRDFIFVGDVAAANLAAATAPAAAASGNVYNVATGSASTLIEALDLIQDISGSRRAPAFAEARVGDIRHSRGDITRTSGDLGWYPATRLREGLGQTLDWLRHSAEAL